jgi:glucose/arabinose dehydrogenase
VTRATAARTRARCAAAVAITVVLGAIGHASPAQAVPLVETSTTLPAGFQQSEVFTGLTNPTVVEFSPDGRVFVAEKNGLIKVFDDLDDVSPTVFADLRTQVHNYWDRGVLGMALDPNFATTSPYVYVYYVHDAPIGGTAPRWGTAGATNDPCPRPPGSTQDGCIASGRISRLKAATTGNVMTGGEQVLVEDYCMQFPSHAGGGMAFGVDGALYVSGGEGANFNAEDYGQFGGTLPDATNPVTPKNPCGDPPGGVGGAMSAPTAEGGALRSQDIRTPATTTDPTGLNGTIIRIDKTTGSPLSSNPLYATGRTPNEKRIVAYGLRNPFRITMRPATSDLYIGDVGSYWWEEIDRISAPTSGVRNFGWPCYEGSNRVGSWDSLNLNLCESLYSSGGVTNPLFAYDHFNPAVPNDRCPTGGASPAGMAFYRGGAYPNAYDGALFYADYNRHCIWVMYPDADGIPDPSTRTNFVTDAIDPVDLKIGPAGDLFYVGHQGSIYRIRYAAPTARATASPTNGPAPLEVTFDGRASTSPIGATLTYAWDLDGNGQFDDATTATAQRVYDAPGVFDARLRVTEPGGLTDTSSAVRITVSNTPPVPTITTPATGTHWRVGQTIAFSGSATDTQDGSIPSSGLSWSLLLHHCSSSIDCHVHGIESYPAVASGSFVVPDHSYPSYLELRLTARDSAGLTATRAVRLDPTTVDLAFAAEPSGLLLSASGVTGQTPFTRRVIVGSRNTVTAPSPQWLGGRLYAFNSWTDGGARTHEIVAPATAATYTARYVQTTVANTCTTATVAAPQRAWLHQALGTGEAHWYRFATTSAHYSRIVLGGLPENYRLDLYTSCTSSPIATSDRVGRHYEEIYRSLAAGTYYVRVSSSGGATSPTAYGLRFTPLKEGVQVLSTQSWLDSAGRVHVAGDILNNTSSRRTGMRITARYYNASNTLIGSSAAYTMVQIVGARTRVPFHVVSTAPAGYHHFALAISAQTTTASGVGRLTVSAAAPSLRGGALHFAGTVRNGNTFTVRNTREVVTIFNAWGGLINAWSAATVPSTLAPGGSASFDVGVAPYSGMNSLRYQTQAIR